MHQSYSAISEVTDLQQMND